MPQAPDAARALIISSGEGRRRIAAVLIEESGFRVDEARNCLEAEAVIAADPDGFRLIFADAVGGDEARAFALRIGRQWPWIRLLVTADPGVAVENWGSSAGRLRSRWLPLDLLVEADRATH